MSRAEKRLRQMRANPNGDWRIADLKLVCEAYGIDLEAPRGGGSHFKVSHWSQRSILTIPSNRPIKPIYIRRLVEFVDAVVGATP